MLALKKKLPEVSLFHHVCLLTVAFLRREILMERLPGKKIILVPVQKVCEWHLFV